MKEQRFSFRHYKLIVLFFIFAAFTYLLYWYFVPNLNYEIPAYYFIALLLAGMGWYVYDTLYKADSIGYIDTYPDCLIAKNLSNRETHYYYRDIHYCTLTEGDINGTKHYRLELYMKSGASVHLRLDNFSGKDIKTLAALITAKTGNAQEDAKESFPSDTMLQAPTGHGTAIYISPVRQSLLAGALLFMGGVMLWMSVSMIIDLLSHHADLFILLLSGILVLMGTGFLYLCFRIARQKIVQLEIGKDGLLMKDMPWGKTGWSQGNSKNRIIDLYFRKKYRFIAYKDIRQVALIPSKWLGDSIVLHTTRQDYYIPLLLENHQQFLQIEQLIAEKLSSYK
ncbi:hypothetical protein [Chitinophaga sp.]|uniref:hypothetical protein n=1 Tax=Chitinophaga sp. TaxID=1869181 RepID=UPI002F94032F